ncbi:MAG: hypothetical protein AAGD96_13055 [Chloroflexota bacterium]
MFYLISLSQKQAPFQWLASLICLAAFFLASCSSTIELDSETAQRIEDIPTIETTPIPTPDIEATIEAQVAATVSASEAAIAETATAESASNTAEIDLTEEEIPTATPSPLPSPTPTPTTQVEEEPTIEANEAKNEETLSTENIFLRSDFVQKGPGRACIHFKTEGHLSCMTANGEWEVLNKSNAPSASGVRTYDLCLDGRLLIDGGFGRPLLIEQDNGWAEISLHTDINLRDVSCLSENNIWVTATNSIWNFDGSEWIVYNIFEIFGDFDTFGSISMQMYDEDQMWVKGSYSDAAEVFARFNGAEWERVIVEEQTGNAYGTLNVDKNNQAFFITQDDVYALTNDGWSLVKRFEAAQYLDVVNMEYPGLLMTVGINDAGYTLHNLETSDLYDHTLNNNLNGPIKDVVIDDSGRYWLATAVHFQKLLSR